MCRCISGGVLGIIVRVLYGKCQDNTAPGQHPHTGSSWSRDAAFGVSSGTEISIERSIKLGQREIG